jgi:cytochrome c-type biogenesis protein CcmH/NrfG
MISRLATRLENDRSDKDGWRTLGWAYLNTQRYGDAVKAYEVALELDPGNVEVKSSLDEARSKISGPAAPAAP